MNENNYNTNLFDIANKSGYTGSIEDFDNSFAVAARMIAVLHNTLANTIFQMDNFKTIFFNGFNEAIRLAISKYTITDGLPTTYTLKLKKTIIKKLPKWEHTSYYYLTIAERVIANIILLSKNTVMNAMMKQLPDTVYMFQKYKLCHDTIQTVLNNPSALAPCINVRCIADNIIEISL